MNSAQLHGMRDALAARFPRCFVPKGADKLPLKIGIHLDLMDLTGFSATRIKTFLRSYCYGPRYQRALLAHGFRVDLDGNVAGEIDAGAKGQAQAALERIDRAAAAQAELRALRLALKWALGVIAPTEPGDSRAVSNAFVSAAAILVGSGDAEALAILRQAIDDFATRPARPFNLRITGERRRIYLASSWRNVDYAAALFDLRAAGHEVYDFKNPAPGNTGFAWSQIDTAVPHGQWDIAHFVHHVLPHPASQDGFELDHAALDWCDTCVLLLPCGKSAHLEAGYSIGAGKETIIVLRPNSDMTFEPELMYLLADKVVESVEDVIAALAPATVSRDALHDAVAGFPPASEQEAA